MLQWNEQDMIGRWISFLYRYNQIFMDKRLKPFGIGGGQFIFLLILYVRDDISPEKLAGILNIDKGTTTVALKKLLEEGYIKREPDPKDHRSYKVCLTPKAEQFKPEFKEILSLWTELLTEGFSDTEKSEASAYLKRMHDNAVKVLKRERG